jgi:hypothetical protein
MTKKIHPNIFETLFNKDDLILLEKDLKKLFEKINNPYKGFVYKNVSFHYVSSIFDEYTFIDSEDFYYVFSIDDDGKIKLKFYF